MKLDYRYLLLAIFLTGCSLFTTPPIDTFNKQVAAFEISYGVLLDKALLHKREGRLSAETKLKLDEIVKNIEVTMNAINASMKIGDITSAETQLELATSTLDLLRSTLAAQEDK